MGEAQISARSATDGGPGAARPRTLRVGLLGGFSVVVGAVGVPDAAFARKKARDLIKVLALHPEHRLHRDQVMDALWGSLDQRAAARELYKAVHYARQALAGAAVADEDLLTFSDALVALSAPGGVDTDVAAFERLAQEAERGGGRPALQRAVAAYTGDLLPADLYEEWTLARRDELRARFLDLLTELGGSHAALGRLAEAADAYRGVIAQGPDREEAHRGLMRVHARDGHPDRAARQFRLCADLLERELGVPPAPETVALAEEIARGAVAPRGPLAPVALFAGPEPPGRLVARNEELIQVRALLDGLPRREGAAVTVTGQPGVGKTRLALQLLQLGYVRGFQPLFGAAHEHEGRVPYGPVIEALRMALRADPAGAELIPAELAVAMPEIALGAPVVTGDRLAARSALFAGVLRFLSRRARTAPLMVAFDDLHAADEGTLQLFRYLAREAAGLPLLVVGAWRTQHPGAAPALDGLVGELARRVPLRQLVLKPLSEPDHEALLAECLGGAVDPALATALYELTEGNPLFATEMVRELVNSGMVDRRAGAWGYRAPDDPRHLRGTLPPSLQTLLRQRLALLSVAGRRLLDLAAVIGRHVSLPVLEAAASSELALTRTADVLDLVEQAVAARLLEEAGLSYRFPHQLFREGLYRQMSAGRRRFLHRHVAGTLERLYPAAEDRPVEALAYHYGEAGDVEAAVGYLLDAGDRAESVYDHDDAVHRYQEGLDLLEAAGMAGANALRASLHERMGDAHRTVGRLEPSLHAYRNALDAAAADGGGGASAAGLHRKIALASLMAADMPAAAEHLARARDAAEADALEEARMLIAEALFQWHMNLLDEAVALGERALDIAEREQAHAEASQACEMLALAHLPQGHWEEGLRYELRREGDWSPDLVVAVDAHLCLWENRIHAEDAHEQAQAFIGRVAAEATAIGSLRCVAVCHYALGSIALLRGRIDDAAEHLAASLELHAQLGSPAGMAYTLSRQVNLATAGGDGSDPGALITRGLQAAQRAAIGDHPLSLVYAAGIRNRLAAGDRRAAVALAGPAERLAARARPCPACFGELLPALAWFRLEGGEPEVAWAYAEQAAAVAGMGNNRVGVARAGHIKGRVLAGRGDAVAAEGHFRDAAATLREFGQRWELAQTLLAWSQLSGSRPLARDAKQILETLGGKTTGRSRP